MSKNTAIKIELPIYLRQRLEEKAAVLHCDLNELIAKALEQFLRKEAPAAFQVEARRQSLLAAKMSRSDRNWERMVVQDFPDPQS